MRTTRTRWLAAAAALIASLLSTAAPAVARTSAAADHVDQWAVGKDWSGTPQTTIDQWAVGKDWRVAQVERAAPATAPRTLTSAQVQLFLAGLLIAAALGGTTAIAFSRHRHTSSAH